MSRTRPPRKPSAREHAPGAFRLHASAPAAESALWTWAPVVVAALFAIALLAMVFGPHRVGDIYTETDFYGGYGPGARLIQRGNLDPSRYAVVGPGFEVVLALVGFVVRDLFVAGELVSCAAMSGAIVLWASLVRRRMNGAAGALVALFLATNTFWFRYGYAATTDALAVLLQAAGLWALLARPLDRRGAAVAGLLAAAAYLTRYNAGVLLPAGLLTIALGWADRRDGTTRRGAALAFAAGFAVLTGPWLAWSLASGAHFAVQLHHNIAFEVFARPRGIPWDHYQRDMQSQFPTPWSVLARDPAAVLGRIATNAVDHLRLDARGLTGYALAIASALGVWFAARERWLPRLMPLLAWAALVFLTLVPVFHAPRYSLPMLPVWAALAAAAFASPRFALPIGARQPVWAKTALALFPLVVAVGANVAFQKEEIRKLPVEVLDGVRAAAPYARPGDRVMARKPHFAWHAGMEPVPFPFADSLPQLAREVHETRTRWLWMSWAEAELRPAFWWMLDTTAHVPGLTVRGVFRPNPAVLYELGPEFGRVPAWMRDSSELVLHTARGRVQVDRRDARSRLYIAVWERDHGRWAEAQPWIEEAAAIQPDWTELAALRGDNLRRMGRTADAVAVLQSVVSSQPDYVPGRAALAWALADAGNGAQAAELWRPLVDAVGDPAMIAAMIDLFEKRGEADVVRALRARRAGQGETR